MKHLFALLIAFVAVLGCQNAVAADNKALKFDESTFDFGTVGHQHGPITHEFTFVNTSDKPAIIISVTASCGCTRPKYTHEPVKPGEKGSITVTFDPKDQAGYVRKNVKVKYMAGDKKVNVTLRICGSIVRAE